jgi:hypothetical protein
MPSAMSSDESPERAPNPDAALAAGVAGAAEAARDAPAVGLARLPRSISISGTVPAPRWASVRWLSLLGLALAELLALWARQSRVLDPEAFRAAAAVVREHYATDDAVVIAPEWADPLLRLHLGDRISLKLAGRSDLAPFERLWVLSFRGARAAEAPAREPDFRKLVEGISVERYDFAPSPVVLDLVDALPSASVDVTLGAERVPCVFRERVAGAQRGGLGFGPAAPRQRFACDTPRESSWVGVTMLEDLSLKPRRCILQRPRPNEPVAVTYRDVHMGGELVLYAGLYYEDERHEQGVPVTMRVSIDGRPRAVFVHRDGDGMKRYQLDTRAAVEQGTVSARGDLRIEVSAPDAIKRSFCWSGSLRDARRREAP